MMLGLFVLAGMAAVGFAGSNEAASRACNNLMTTYPGKLFLPDNPTYVNESTHLWSETCLRSPSCVFLPDDAQDIAGGLAIIKEASSQFAIRSGGHMPVPGAASTEPGVMISMTNLDTMEFNTDKSIARIGPGNIWGQVYNWTSEHGLAVNGGRYGSVGVGGLLLGGGIGYFGNRFGWSANSVVQYEVVLANCSVALVTATSTPDLFWALKGGSNNFAIITRYDMQTIPAAEAFAGGALWMQSELPAFFDALNSYLAPGGAIDDPYTAINPVLALTPHDGVFEAGNVVFHLGNDSNPATLANFTKVGNAIYNSFSLRPNWNSLANELNQPAYAARTSRQLFWSVGMKADPRAISIANITILGGAMEALKNVSGMTITLAYQPISMAWLEAAQAAGGDAINVDPADGPFIAGLISSTWDNEADDETVIRFCQEAVQSVIEQTNEAGVSYPFVYLNDAALGQDPFAFYGGGNSISRLREIQDLYDPDGLFRNLAAGGFKLQS